MRTLITHTDLDGVGCAILAIFYNKADRIICAPNKNDLSDWSMFGYFNNDEITITDLPLTLSGAIKYDHHDGEDKCSTRQYYDNAISTKNETIDRFVHLIDVYDRWEKDDPDFQDACDLNRLFISMIPQTKICTVYYNKITESVYKEFIEQMLEMFSHEWKYSIQQRCTIAIQRTRENILYDKMVEACNEYSDSHDNKYAISNISRNATETGNRYLDEHPDVKYILLTNGARVFARSKIFDLTQLQGLKGHPGAASGYYSNEYTRDLYNGLTSLEYV